MSTEAEITRLMESRLNTLSNKPSIAWPNVDFEPSLGNSYFRSNIIKGIPVKIGNADNDKFVTVSLMQIDIHTPKGKGAQDALAYVESVYSHFPVGFEMTTPTDGYKLRIMSRRTEVGQTIGTHYVVPVLIEFKTITD